ncbi:hypothetical protein BFP72_03015 [Reichenbachiella sp. 5M10]|uniref:hypothetical protein n=1 Tax=Reichenbachiella sp. 5M10 TaxID=1889772 RepID=UPI000C148CFC|nr:hypothetical protein [Reichenbachiella sp. 5M10]PIB34457.1 hypothetical protein BFP72_03015 [Reichenbachiella sp. 5M10]
MIVWSGKGILSVLILVLAFVLLFALLPAAHFQWAFSLSFFIAGAFSWFMGKKWNAQQSRIVIDKASGQEIELKTNHSLFWIKMQYWGILFGIIGVLFLVLMFK